MEDKPVESETIETPVEAFKKGKAKREAKRKEVKVITEYTPPPAEYVPEPPAETKPLSEAVEVPPAPTPVIDVDSIADRVADKLFAKMAVEKVEVDKTPEVKTKARPKPPAKKKESAPTPPPPPAKYFGWC